MKETKLKIWVSSANEGKKQERKTPKKQCKTWKWEKKKKGLVSKSPWYVNKQKDNGQNSWKEMITKNQTWFHNLKNTNKREILQ
jgi:hypothetical protein